MNRLIFYFAALFFLSHTAQAKPKVLAELGHTSPVPFVVAYLKTIDQSINASFAIGNGIHQVMPGDAYEYPIETERMQPGALVGKTVKTSMFAQPMAFMGDDGLSIKWLEQNHGYLASQNVPLFLVNLASESSYKFLQKRFPGLQFYPLDADELASLAGLSRYPILVTTNGAFQ